jgi:hypothetical protein
MKNSIVMNIAVDHCDWTPSTLTRKHKGRTLFFPAVVRRMWAWDLEAAKRPCKAFGSFEIISNK